MSRNLLSKTGNCLSLLMTVLFIALAPLTGAAQDHGKTLKIGAILPLSGIFAEYGVAMKNGISLALLRDPEAARNITFIYEDAQSGSQNAIAAFNKLTTTDRVNLVYVFGVQFSQALAPLARARKVPLVSQCVNDEVARDNQYVVRFMNHAAEYTQVSVDYLRKHNFRNLEVVTSEQSYIEDMYRVLEASLRKDEQLKKSERPASETDFRATIARLRSNPPEALGVYLLPGQISAFYKQLREQHFTLPTFGVNTFESQSEIARAEGAMEGAVFPNHHVEENFRQQYLASFGNDLQITWAALAYEFTRLNQRFLSALLAAESGEKILAAYAAMPAQTGEATGTYQFASNREAGAYFRFPLVLKEIRGNRIVERP